MLEKHFNIFIDLLAVRVHNIGKLFTREDFNHVHKIIGFTALAHYFYRMYSFLTVGSMMFDNSRWTVLAIILHTTLSLSSLIFRIPDSRVRSGPMIYPEFRLHSIVFALRSLVIMTILFVSRYFEVTFPLYLRGFVILGTMKAADMITESFKNQGTTMRGMPFPEYVPLRMRDNINMYYSISQIFASAQMLFCYRLDEAFLVLFPIQIAAFLMTCVRKSIVSPGAWHFYYAISLGLNYILAILLNMDNPSGGFFTPVALGIMIARFNTRWNKYYMWSAGILCHLFAMLVLNRYTVVRI